MYITPYSSHISENLKYDYSLCKSFIRVFERISPEHYKTCSQSKHLFSAFYVFSLKFIFPLALKILMSVKFEYYGICVEKSYRPFVSGVA